MKQLILGAALTGALIFAGCGNKVSRFTNGGVEVTAHQLPNGVICYTAQLGDAVSIDCK